mgnify:FL=1
MRTICLLLLIATVFSWREFKIFIKNNSPYTLGQLSYNVPGGFFSPLPPSIIGPYEKSPELYALVNELSGPWNIQLGYRHLVRLPFKGNDPTRVGRMEILGRIHHPHTYDFELTATIAPLVKGKENFLPISFKWRYHKSLDCDYGSGGWQEWSDDYSGTVSCMMLVLSDLKANSVDIFQYTENYIQRSVMEFIGTCIFKDVPAFKSAKGLLSYTETFSGSAWSIGDTKQYLLDSFITEEGCKSFYRDYGFKQVSCSNLEDADVIVFCQQDENGGCVKYYSSYFTDFLELTVVAVKIKPGKWSGKFNYGPLFVFDSPEDIINTNEDCVPFHSSRPKFCFVDK